MNKVHVLHVNAIDKTRSFRKEHNHTRMAKKKSFVDMRFNFKALGFQNISKTSSTNSWNRLICIFKSRYHRIIVPFFNWIIGLEKPFNNTIASEFSEYKVSAE